MKREKRTVKKYREYISGDGYKTLIESMALLHEAYNDMLPEQKEEAYIHTLMTFPETIAYAMLKLSSLKIDVAERFRDEYQKAYKTWLEDIETELVLGFGVEGVGIFLTYAKLYILGMNEHVDTLMGRIEETFSKRKEERERQGWIHKKIY